MDRTDGHVRVAFAGRLTAIGASRPVPALKIDGFVKCPSAALRCMLRHCSVPVSTPYSSEFARLASGAFYFAIPILSFYEFIKIEAPIVFGLPMTQGYTLYIPEVTTEYFYRRPIFGEE